MGYVQMKPYSALAAYLLDSEEDLNSLPSSPAGSTAELADATKKWVLAPSGEWAEEEISSGGGEGGGGATNVFEYIEVVKDSQGNFTTTIAPTDFLKYYEEKPGNLLLNVINADGTSASMLGVSPTYSSWNKSIMWYVFGTNIDYNKYMDGRASGGFGTISVGYDDSQMNVYFEAPAGQPNYVYWKQSSTT